MIKKKKWSYKIEAQDIDFKRDISLKSLTNYILITAGKNADENGFGIMELQNKNLTWVLTRLLIEMERIPTENDTISIETWVYKIGTLFTIRNFRLADQSGESIGWASSTWAVMDMQTRRSVQLNSIPSMQHYLIPEPVPIGEPHHLADADGEPANSFRVRYSNIDVNNHANSLFYIEWISDCFSLDFYLRNSIRRFEINFLKELTIDDSGKVYRQEVAPSDYHFRIVTCNGDAVCRARILFDPK